MIPTFQVKNTEAHRGEAGQASKWQGWYSNHRRWQNSGMTNANCSHGKGSHPAGVEGSFRIAWYPRTHHPIPPSSLSDNSVLIAEGSEGCCHTCRATSKSL